MLNLETTAPLVTEHDMPGRQSLCGLDEENWGEWNKMEGRVSLE